MMYRIFRPSVCNPLPILTILAACLLVPFTNTQGAQPKKTLPPTPAGLHFINTGIENGSPLYWDMTDDGIQLNFIYDYERNSPNRANGHWHFEIQGEPGSDFTLLLNNFKNIYNGHAAWAISDKTVCFVSDDGKTWRTTPTRFLKDKKMLEVKVHMNGPRLWVARIPPYRISDLERFKETIAKHPQVCIENIGKTVQGRTLEMIRIGDPNTEHCIVLRARAHPWEPGGNWVVEGLIRRLIDDSPDAKKFLSKYCVYIMPMANKDGVAAGRTRFNMLGMDLNRKWDKPADPTLSPENDALEKWLQKTLKNRKIDLLIDFHNDDYGQIHVSRPPLSPEDTKAYLDKVKRFDSALRKHTWFTEGCSGSNFRNPGTLGEGMLERYGIVAFIHELNANHIAGLNEPPTSKNWMLYGHQLAEAFYEYFTPQDK